VRRAPHTRQTCLAKLTFCKATWLRAALLPKPVCFPHQGELDPTVPCPKRPCVRRVRAWGRARPTCVRVRAQMLPGSSSQAPASHPLPDCPSQPSSSSAPGGDLLDEPFSPTPAALLLLASCSTPDDGDFRVSQRCAGAIEQVSCSFTADALARLPGSSTPPCCDDSCSGQPAGAALHSEEQPSCSGAPHGDSIPAQPPCDRATLGLQASRGAACYSNAPAEQHGRADVEAEARPADRVPSGAETPVARRCGLVPGAAAHRSSSSMLEDRDESAGSPIAALAGSALRELHASCSGATPVAVTGSGARSPQARALVLAQRRPSCALLSGTCLQSRPCSRTSRVGAAGSTM
jgi:hypothetical protein